MYYTTDINGVYLCAEDGVVYLHSLLDGNKIMVGAYDGTCIGGGHNHIITQSDKAYAIYLPWFRPMEKKIDPALKTTLIKGQPFRWSHEGYGLESRWKEVEDGIQSFFSYEDKPAYLTSQGQLYLRDELVYSAGLPVICKATRVYEKRLMMLLIGSDMKTYMLVHDDESQLIKVNECSPKYKDFMVYNNTLLLYDGAVWDTYGVTEREEYSRELPIKAVTVRIYTKVRGGLATPILYPTK